ncbi:hypothetical protein DSO57_1017969 [Entomophthora muscae]|uniref:Uncharacterized protein n=1 Tax=Entomophthora muscae TaxID=34485 RepID=A0ACC2SH48_9FUNG|nr:hypothetical protein DSO57_1017969 [Entomophthora muscae]
MKHLYTAKPPTMPPTAEDTGGGKKINKIIGDAVTPYYAPPKAASKGTFPDIQKGNWDEPLESYFKPGGKIMALVKPPLV